MNVKRIKVANLRAIEALEFRFQPGCNLIVGVNGVGKTSVLDALARCLSMVIKDTNPVRTSVETFTADDIRIGAEALTVECEFDLGGAPHTFLIHRPRTGSAPRLKKTGMPREQVHSTPERAEYLGNRPGPATGKEPHGRPFALLFSTRRAVPSDRAPSKAAAAGGIAAAYADAFSDRELRLGEFAAWMRVRRTLGRERPANRRVLAAFEESIRRFLPEYSNLRVSEEKKPILLIDHGRATLEVRQLSDGERGTLAMVLDLTRRLAQANPNMDDPAGQAEAIVLIDEIDLHLHPGWQRQIVQNLTSAFPRCQFIATTHSPQVIGEVEHERIQIISHGQVYSPSHSFGVDSSRVLEEVMESIPRNAKVQKLLSQISNAISKKSYASANKLVTKLIEQVGEDDPEVTRTKTLLEFMGENE
jgi:predicted ATP-binding protein involved in virulence